MSCRKVKQTGLQVGNLVGVYTLTSVWIISRCVIVTMHINLFKMSAQCINSKPRSVFTKYVAGPMDHSLLTSSSKDWFQ